MRKLWIIAVLVASSFTSIRAANADVVTWTLTGTINDYYNVNAYGAYAGLPAGVNAIGQDYSLTFTFGSGGPINPGYCGFFNNFCIYTNAGETATVTYAGYTFQIGPLLGPSGFTDRRSNHRYSITNIPNDLDSELLDTLVDNTVGNGGSATTDLPGATQIEIGFGFENDNDGFLPYPPIWPDSLGNIDNFWYRSFSLIVYGPNQGDLLNLFVPISAFSTFRSSADEGTGDGVPVPGALALLGLGLLGVGATRRKLI